MVSRVSFTYGSYPNLWDDIIAYADAATLVQLRHTSQALREAIDKAVRHLILSPLPAADPVEPPTAVSVSVPKGSLALQCLSQLDLLASEGEDLLTDSTQVVDLLGFFHPEFELGDLDDFPSLHTLRLCPDAAGLYVPYAPFACRTLVLFPEPAGLRANKAHPFLVVMSAPRDEDDDDDDDDDDDYFRGQSGWPDPPQPPRLLEDMLPMDVDDDFPPHDVKDVVVNLGGTGASPPLSFHFLAHPLEHVERMTVIVPRYRSLDAAGEVDLFPSPDALADIMRTPRAQYTIVGVDDAPVDGFNYEAYKESVRHALKVLLHNGTQADVDYQLDDGTMGGFAKMIHVGKSIQMREERVKKAVRERRRARGGIGSRAADREDTAEIKRLIREEKGRLVGLKQWVEERLARLEFISLAEYRQRVGEDAAALHVLRPAI